MKKECFQWVFAPSCRVVATKSGRVTPWVTRFVLLGSQPDDMPYLPVVTATWIAHQALVRFIYLVRDRPLHTPPAKQAISCPKTGKTPKRERCQCPTESVGRDFSAGSGQKTLMTIVDGGREGRAETCQRRCYPSIISGHKLCATLPPFKQLEFASSSCSSLPPRPSWHHDQGGPDR